MSQYIQTPAQKAFLKRRAISQKKNIRSCDCPGCDKCTGNVAGCTCDEMSAAEALAVGRRGVVW